jgi:hypothetical protein
MAAKVSDNHLKPSVAAVRPVQTLHLKTVLRIGDVFRLVQSFLSYSSMIRLCRLDRSFYSEHGVRFRFALDVRSTHPIETLRGSVFKNNTITISSRHSTTCSAAALYNHTLVCSHDLTGSSFNLYRRGDKGKYLLSTPLSSPVPRRKLSIGINRNYFVSADPQSFTVWDTMNWDEPRLRGQYITLPPRRNEMSTEAFLREVFHTQGETILALDAACPIAVLGTTLSHDLKVCRWGVENFNTQYLVDQSKQRPPEAMALHQSQLAVVWQEELTIYDLGTSQVISSNLIQKSETVLSLKFQERFLFKASTDHMTSCASIFDLRTARINAFASEPNSAGWHHCDLQGNVVASYTSNLKGTEVTFRDWRMPGHIMTQIALPKAFLTLFQLCGDTLYTVAFDGSINEYNFVKDQLKNASNFS